MLGCDTLFPRSTDNDELLRIALRENRILLTRNTGIMARRIVTTDKVKVLLIESDNVREQFQQVVNELNLQSKTNSFSLCLLCNVNLVPKEKEEICNLIPPYVFKTQQQFMQCPGCARVFWRDTHWERMMKEIEDTCR